MPKNYSALISPQAIFSIGLIQSLFIYIHWSLNDKNPHYEYEITFRPLIIIITSYLFFFAGCSLFTTKHRSPSRIHPFIMSKKWMWLLVISWVFIFASTMDVYGGLALYRLYTGDLSVKEINDLQATGFPGQFGILLVLNTLCMISCAALIISKSFKRKGLYTSIFFLISILGSLSAGKRQGIFILLSIVSIAYIAKMNSESKKVPKSLIITLAIAVGSLLATFALIGQMRDSDTGIINYMEYPLINFEWQIENFKFMGGGNIFPMIAGFFPYKMLINEETIAGLGEGENPVTQIIFGFVYPEPGIGAGFYGALHLGVGFIGCIVFALILGACIGRLYQKSHNNIHSLMLYCICAWPLASSLSYNLFLVAGFFLVPTVASIAYLKRAIIPINPIDWQAKNKIQ